MPSLQEQVDSLGPWYHDVDLGNGVKTGTKYHHVLNPENRWNEFAPYLPANLKGRSVLDVGCNSGYMAVKYKKRGAGKVVALDIEERHIRQAQLLAKCFNVDIETVCQNIHHYMIAPPFKQFDIVHFTRVLYHLRFGDQVFAALCAMTKDFMVFSTEMISNEGNVYNAPLDMSPVGHEKVMAQPNYPKLHFIENAYSGDWSNWGIPNEAYVLALIRSCGMEIVHRPHFEMFILRPTANVNKMEPVEGGKFYYPETRGLLKRRIAQG